MTLREKLMHYTHDLDCGVDLKQEAIATIEHIAQYMDEDELLYHSRPLAIAYLALTEDTSVPVVRCKDCEHAERYERTDGTAGYYCGHPQNTFAYGEYWDRVFKPVKEADDFCSYGERREE